MLAVNDARMFWNCVAAANVAESLIDWSIDWLIDLFIYWYSLEHVTDVHVRNEQSNSDNESDTRKKNREIEK